MIAGAGGQFLASPADLVKIRLQVEGKRVLEGHPPRLVQGPHTLNHCNSHPCIYHINVYIAICCSVKVRPH